ncbi:hypothetical protein N7456_009365 [Penicillium angulare]|uniref:Uncharacterized protein n=1 Tax=Penicillium angulare TaxID=116970 RepID=A0A9W9F4K8_9EURO|nr:hypothetical protein N7456_009365 [Penicillium angulare]
MSEKQARESFASILSYYQNYRASLENVPNWVDDPKSQEIVIGFLRASAPTEEQVEEAKEELRAFMAMEEMRASMGEAAFDLLDRAAKSSRVKRSQKN